MKRMIVLLLALPVFLACAHLQESDDVDPVVHGSWVGEARFYDRHLKEEYGKFPVAIEIHSDNSVSGTVGGAILGEGVIKSRRDDFLIQADLIGQIFDAGSLPGEKKDTVVFILMPPGDASTDGDFHLKTNLTFDFKMRAGELKLSRSS
jgi:hypothetical protein